MDRDALVRSLPFPSLVDDRLILYSLSTLCRRMEDMEVRQTLLFSLSPSDADLFPSALAGLYVPPPSRVQPDHRARRQQPGFDGHVGGRVWVGKVGEKAKVRVVGVT